MKHNHSHGMGKHMLLMLICCLVPLALVAAVGTFGLSLGPLQGLVPYVAALMCPLMMIGMMWLMMKNQGEGDSRHEHHSTPQLPASNVDQRALETRPAADAAASTGSTSCH